MTQSEELAREEGFAAGLAEGIETGRIRAQSRCLEILEIPILKNIYKVAVSYVRDNTVSAGDIRRKLVDGRKYDELVGELTGRGLSLTEARAFVTEEFPDSWSEYIGRTSFRG